MIYITNVDLGFTLQRIRNLHAEVLDPSCKNTLGVKEARPYII